MLGGYWKHEIPDRYICVELYVNINTNIINEKLNLSFRFLMPKPLNQFWWFDELIHIGDKLVLFSALIAFTPEIDCDQTAMGLPLIMAAVLLIAEKVW
jgi:hypothetical protein